MHTVSDRKIGSKPSHAQQVLTLIYDSGRLTVVEEGVPESQEARNDALKRALLRLIVF